MTYADYLIQKYQSQGLMLDSNLLLLYLIGRVNSSLVGGDYSRLSSFTYEQVFILDRLIGLFARVVTTAHVLTEVSNLVNNELHGAYREQVFAAFVSTLQIISEQEISSYQAARRAEFSYLGLTDSVLAEMSDRFLIVSNDARMVDLLRQSGIEALKWVEVLGLSS